MSEIVLPGSDAIAFDHLVGYGAAAIIDALDPGSTRLHWTDELEPRLVLSGVTWKQLGEEVHLHAKAHAQPGSWVNCDGINGGTARGLFSPRVKAMSTEDAQEWFGSRARALDGLTGLWATLDRAFIGALGQPSYWSFDRGEPRPDHGASRWEMKTRNRGEEFVGNRLRLVGESVARRTPQQIVSGLAGTTSVDEVGGSRGDSRTPTGLKPPGATDNARAWCALWGLSLLPIVQRVDGVSVTAGHVGRPTQGYFYLPLPIAPSSLVRLRVILRSAHLRAVASAGLSRRELATAVPAFSELESAWEWLHARGVVATLRFPVHRSANEKAPERWAQRGVKLLPGEAAVG